MRTYGMSYQAVMSMPIRAFWTVSGFVERLRADEGKSILEITASAQSGESAQSLMERLDSEAPHPVKYTGEALAAMGADRDEAGFADLKSMAF